MPIGVVYSFTRLCNILLHVHHTIYPFSWWSETFEAFPFWGCCEIRLLRTFLNIAFVYEFRGGAYPWEWNCWTRSLPQLIRGPAIISQSGCVRVRSFQWWMEVHWLCIFITLMTCYCQCFFLCFLFSRDGEHSESRTFSWWLIIWFWALLQVFIAICEVCFHVFCLKNCF